MSGLPAVKIYRVFTYAGPKDKFSLVALKGGIKAGETVPKYRLEVARDYKMSVQIFNYREI